jgi:hypothetical protein
MLDLASPIAEMWDAAPSSVTLNSVHSSRGEIGFEISSSVLLTAVASQRGSEDGGLDAALHAELEHD